MPSSAFLTLLQWAITASGGVAFVLALLSWNAAWGEREAVIRTRTNGYFAATVRAHLITATSRACAATLSMFGGIVLMVLPDFALWSGVVAGCSWLAYNLLMTLNLTVEWRMREQMRMMDVTTAAKLRIDERTAERLDRIAERLEREAERRERKAEHAERDMEHLERDAEHAERQVEREERKDHP